MIHKKDFSSYATILIEDYFSRVLHIYIHARSYRQDHHLSSQSFPSSKDHMPGSHLMRVNLHESSFIQQYESLRSLLIPAVMRERVLVTHGLVTTN